MKERSLLLVLGLLSCLWPVYGSLAEPETNPTIEALPSLQLDPTRVTVSGVSSGAFFAQQFHVIHSSLVKGSAPVAGGVFWCAQGDSKKAQADCMGQSGGVSVESSLEKARELEQANLIDPLQNFAKGRAFVFHGQKDGVIHPGHSDHSLQFYRSFMEEERVRRVKNEEAGHGFPTIDFGNACAQLGLPWMLKCGVDLASDVLAFLEETEGKASSAGQMVDFDQKEFGGPDQYLYPWGSLYIPDACKQGGCGLHIAFHGCQMNPDYIQKKFIENAGYQKPANLKGVVVLFPQVAKGKGNPFGCWDWFGFAGSDYVTKNGVQVRAVKAMIDRLMAQKSGVNE
jgi:poly(3-hydroxybutyrate) depolymerase